MRNLFIYYLNAIQIVFQRVERAGPRMSNGLAAAEKSVSAILYFNLNFWYYDKNYFFNYQMFNKADPRLSSARILPIREAFKNDNAIFISSEVPRSIDSTRPAAKLLHQAERCEWELHQRPAPDRVRRTRVLRRRVPHSSHRLVVRPVDRSRTLERTGNFAEELPSNAVRLRSPALCTHRLLFSQSSRPLETDS